MAALKVVADEIVSDAHDVVYLVLALGHIERMIERNNRDDFFLDESMELIVPRLTKRLIALAGVLRNFVFENKPVEIAESDWKQASDRYVGLLVEEEKEVALSLRDACNKIIHSKSIKFWPESGVLSSDFIAKFDILDSAILTGSQWNKSWTAIVNLPAFAASAFVSAQLVAGES